MSNKVPRGGSRFKNSVHSKSSNQKPTVGMGGGPWAARAAGKKRYASAPVKNSAANSPHVGYIFGKHDD